MNILIPMAGEGKRFVDKGYKESKPAILTYDRHTGKAIPMVVCATKDLPGVIPDGGNLIYVDRSYHKSGGVEDKIKNFYSKARFITIDQLTEGQASTCLRGKNFINNDEELLIAGCDNGMEYSIEKFDRCRSEADVIVFTYRNNEAVLANPDAYGWMKVNDNDEIIDISIKKALSDTPMQDHAVVATFWFKMGKIFVNAAERMIQKDDRINGEFYVDQVIKYVIELGYRAVVFEIDRYIGWGTPHDYEIYQKTFEYWRGFYERKMIL